MTTQVVPSAATAEAEKEAAFRQGEKEKLTADLAMFNKEKEAIGQYQQALAKKYTETVEQMKATYVANRRMVSQIAAAQLQAAQEIDARGAAAAAAGGVSAP